MTFKKNDSAKLQRLLALADKGLVTNVGTTRIHAYNCPCGGTCSGDCTGTSSPDCVCQNGCSGNVTFG